MSEDANFEPRVEVNEVSEKQKRFYLSALDRFGITQDSLKHDIQQINDLEKSAVFARYISTLIFSKAGYSKGYFISELNDNNLNGLEIVSEHLRSQGINLDIIENTFRINLNEIAKADLEIRIRELKIGINETKISQILDNGFDMALDDSTLDNSSFVLEGITEDNCLVLQQTINETGFEFDFEYNQPLKKANFRLR